MPRMLLIAFLLCSGQAWTVENTDLRDQVLSLLRVEFPQADMQPMEDGGFAFAHRTRTFTVYRTNKLGDWQPARENTGPDRGGFMVRFVIKPGRWEGALMVPYAGTTDLHVFLESRVIRNSADGTCYLWAEVITPPMDGRPDLRQRLVQLFNTFDGTEPGLGK